MGFDLILFDGDDVSPENIGSQNFGFPEIGMKKVEALKERLEKKFQIAVISYAENFEGQKELSGIVISGVDKLETRVKIWEENIKFNPLVPLYIDGRVGGERFKVFSLSPCDPENIERYETHLDLRNPVTEITCTSKFAPQAGVAISWIVICLLQELITGKEIPFQLTGENFAFRKIA